MTSVKSILAFDLDGTLTLRNTTKILPDGLPALFNEFTKLGHLAVLVTGKPAPYALRIVGENALIQKGVIAENASVYSHSDNSEVLVFGKGVEKIKQLKQLLGMSPDARGKTTIIIDGTNHETIVDPEDISILTLFTNAKSVAHRWQFEQTVATEEVFQNLRKLIKKNNLENDLEVLSPFPDGGIQVVRKMPDSGITINKSCLPIVAKTMFDLTTTVPIAMFGDGHNDIPAMAADGVLPLTFSNAEDAVKQFAQQHEGYVSKYPSPEGLGVPDDLLWLATKTPFFGDDADEVISLILRHFSKLNR